MGDFADPGFFQQTPDLVCVAGKDGFFRNVNAAVIQKLGFTEEELFAKPISSFIHPDDRELTNNRRSQLLGGSPLLNFENRYITKAGEVVWLEWTSIYFPDKEIVFAIAKDVTTRKQIEKEIEEKYKKFKSLATYFKSSIEQDRKFLATELHEELAQLASVLKLDIDWIKTNTDGLPDASKHRIEHAFAISDLLLSTIRRISFSISPNMIDDLGLNATLDWLCKEFSVLNGIPCKFIGSYNEGNLSPEVKLDFFRISQASLTNVMYHAQANNVCVSLEDIGDLITLTVTDDGKGFFIDEHLQKHGLKRMRDRATSINGDFVVNSEAGKGTRVCVTVPKFAIDR